MEHERRVLALSNAGATVGPRASVVDIVKHVSANHRVPLCVAVVRGFMDTHAGAAAAASITI